MNGMLMRTKILTALVVLGFTTILSQLIFIRELLNVFQGNELVIGLILCIWMLLTAVGSRLAQRLLRAKENMKIISYLFLVEGILPAVLILLLYLLETILFPPGTTKGIATAFFFCLGLLLPCCLLAGMLFTMLAATLSGITGKNYVSAAYGWESGGSMVAGLLFSMLLVYLLKTFQLLALIILINLAVYKFLSPANKPEWKTTILPGILIILSIMLFLSPADKWVKSFHFRNQNLLYTKDTPYGNISVTQTARQLNFYENGTLIFSTENNILAEEAVHFALLQHPMPVKILIVSGGITGMTKEVLKYKSVRSIDYLEINPWLVMAEKRFSGTIQEPGLQVISSDARKWIKKVASVYDAIIVNTPDPSSAQINRYYTQEFFREAQQALRPNGVFSISLSPTINYMSADAAAINGIIYQTLKSVFQQVEVIPGERNYYVASDTALGIDIANRVRETGIENEYVNPYYIEDDLLRQNNRQIMDYVSTESTSLNTDMAPLAYFLQIRYWLSIYKGNHWIKPIIMLMLMLILILFVLRKISAVTAGVFTSGFAGASSEFLILIVFQIIYGNVYQMLGIIVAFYMFGLTAGAVFRVQRAEKVTVRSYIIVQILLLLLIMLIPVVTASTVTIVVIPGWMIRAMLLIITAAIAFAAGLTFNKASKLEHQKIEKIAGSLYGVDLTGAACGSLLVSLVCFPLLGLQYTCLLIASLILLSILVMLINRKKYG
jgi:spermidine synthase